MLYSTEAVGSGRVPDVRPGFPGSIRAPAAGAAVVAGASGSAAHAGRPRGQAPCHAVRWTARRSRAPPPAPLSRPRPRAGNDAGPMCGTGPATSDHSQSAMIVMARCYNHMAARHQRRIGCFAGLSLGCARRASIVHRGICSRGPGSPGPSSLCGTHHEEQTCPHL